MNKDLHNSISVCVMREAADYTANANSNLLNRTGFESCEILVAVGALQGVDGSNYLVISLQECDTTAGTSFTNVATTDLLGAFTKIDATSEDSIIQRVGYLGNKKYLRVVLTETGSITTGSIIGVYAILGNARHQVATDVTAVSAT